MPSKRNLKNYCLVEVIQPKDYMTLVKEKLCLSVEEIILSYVFEQTRRQTHACKLNIDYDMERLRLRYLDDSKNGTHELLLRGTTNMDMACFKAITSQIQNTHYIRWYDTMWQKTECAVCKKKFANINLQTKEYFGENFNAPDQFADDSEWMGDVCNKCDERYKIARLHEHAEDHGDEEVFVNFMREICKGETQAERDEIAYKWIDERQDSDSDEERPLCKDCEIETKKYCDVCGGYGDSDEDW